MNDDDDDDSDDDDSWNERGVINHYLTQELFENVLQYQKIPTISNNID